MESVPSSPGAPDATPLNAVGEESVGRNQHHRVGDYTVMDRTLPTNDQRSSSVPVAPTLSVIVPTKNEAENVGPLARRLTRAMGDHAFEIIFVDDSDDHTADAIAALRHTVPCDVVLVRRRPNQRGDGLAGAVVTGVRLARAPFVCVMDADLQHPPELVPNLVAKVQESGADLVIASRYTDQGSVGGFGRLRAAASHASILSARCAFPFRLRGVTDPMSGFFVLRRSAVDVDQLRPRGFKILLEILVRNPRLRTEEVGFEFGERQAGQSKASLREGLRYLHLLWDLRLSEETRRFARFATVGASGLIVNTAALALFSGGFGIHYLLAALLATQVSTLWLFIWTDLWVFEPSTRGFHRGLRLVLYFVMNNAAYLLRGPMLYVLTGVFGIYYLVSNLISLLTLTVLRFAIADTWIWGKSKTHRPMRAWYDYNIHGIVTVRSQEWLPELERFLVTELEAEPTILVRIGRPRSRGVSSNGHGELDYDEGMAGLGFSIHVTHGDTIEVTASPLLRYSPHVLYTNVVEPILRWTFVRNGYALVHAACVAFGSDAYLVTARTDTGKTTTILRILYRQRRATDTGAFISDDLVLVRSDGRVLTYPKPLTISRHTVAAINTPMLTRRERLGLVVQSRLHSRGGRQFAQRLAETGLPVATINAVVQWLVPPPKYQVDRLVPRVRFASNATLAGMFIIERDGDGELELTSQDAVEILLQNCEDAYGFPPYPAIEDYLHGVNEADLRVVERGIITAAIGPLPATLIRSRTMDWAQRIPGLVGVIETRRSEQTNEHLGRLQPAPPVPGIGT